MKTIKNSLLTLTFLLFVHTQLIAQDVVYVPTKQKVVEAMLDLAKVQSSDIVYDLGCGDGRIVITAASKHGATGKGIDIDPERIEEANRNAEDAQVTDKVKFELANLFETDFSEASVVTLYLLNSLNAKLRPILLDQLKPGSRIVSHSFHMGDWEPDQKITVEGATVYLWTVPEK